MASELIEGLAPSANADLDKFLKNLIKVNAEIDKANRTPINIGGGQGGTRQFVTEMENLNRAIAEQRNGVQQLTQVRQASNRQTQEEITNNGILAQNARQNVLANSQLAGAYRNLQAQQAIAARRVQDLIARGREATQTQRQYDAELRVAQREFTNLNTRVVSANRAIGRFNDNVGNYPRFASGLRSLIGAFGIVGGVTLFATLSRDIFNTAKELQGLDLALKNVTRTNEVYGQTQEFLQRISEAYGIEINGLTRSYTGFLAASQNAIDTGQITAKQIQDIFESVSKASGAMGLSVEQQQGAFLALQQMISKGNIQAEEIRGQLAERLPGAFGILAKSMGVTEQELNKLLKDGQVLAAEVLPAFARELERAYGVENLERVESLAASTTRLGNAWTEFVRSVSEGDSVLTKTLIGTLNAITGVIDGLSLLTKNEKERREDQLKKIEENGYKAQLDLLKDMNKEEAKLAEYAAKETISSGSNRLSELRIAREQLDITIETLKQQSKESNNFAVLNKNRRIIRDSQTKYNQSLEETQLILGQMRAASEFLNKEEEKGFTKRDTKAKQQKADIDYLKDVYELRRQNIQNELDGLTDVMNNDKKAYEFRLEAANNYLFQRKALIELERQEELRLNDLNLKNQKESYQRAIADGKATYSNLNELEYQHSIRKEKINADYEGKKNALAIENAKKLQGVLEAILDQRRINLIDEKQLNDIRQLNTELANVTTGTSYQKFKELEERKTKITDDQNEKRIQIELQRTREQINALTQDEIGSKVYEDLRNKEIKLQTDLANVEEERLKKTAALTKELKKATDDYLSSFSSGKLSELGFGSLEKFFSIEENGKSVFENLLEGADGLDEQFAVVFNSITEVAQEAFNFLNQQSKAYFNQRYADLEREKDLALQFAGESEAGKAEIERQYEERRRAIRRQELQQEKEAAIFNAVIDTAQGVVASLAKGGPAGIALAAVIAGLGAAQIALIASQPIPAYKHGTDNHKGGIALVGDGGKHEVVWQPTAGWSITPNKDTLVNLEKGSKVFPDIASSGLFKSNLPDMIALNNGGLNERQMDNIMRKYSKPKTVAPQVHVHNHNIDGLMNVMRSKPGKVR